MAALANRLVLNRSWERLGFARLRDYATERLGLSARSIHDLAHVHGALTELPRIEGAFVSGQIPWTTVRLLARVATPADEREWLDRAREMPAAALAREVRRVDVGALEQGGFDADDEEGTDPDRENIIVRCTPQVQGKWHGARQLAWRVVGHPVQPWECAEMVAAEVLSALPMDGIAGTSAEQEDAEQENEARVGGVAGRRDGPRPSAERRDADAGDEGQSSDICEHRVAPERSAGSLQPAADDAEGPDGRPDAGRWNAPTGLSRVAHESEPWLRSLVGSLLENIETAGPFQLDRRLRRAVRLEQRLDAELGARLAPAAHEHLHLAHGIARFDVYVRERFGLAPRKVRALLRLERARHVSPALGQAYRDGRLSWVQAHALIPVLLIAHGRTDSDAWIAWATQVSVRRLRDDVDRALCLNEIDPLAFARTAGLPAVARGTPAATGAALPVATPDIRARVECHMESAAALGVARVTNPAGESTTPSQTPRPNDDLERQIGAQPTSPAETSMFFVHAPRPVARLVRAVLCTVRRAIERETGRLPTDGEAFEAMLEHAFDAWAPPSTRTRAAHRIFERDGWRCTAPGCSSFRNLHDHHIVFRSAGGGNDPANRTTLCAGHHLRGIHKGIVRCTGTAPDGLRFEFGVRSVGPPLVTFGPGERIEAGATAGIALPRIAWNRF